MDAKFSETHLMLDSLNEAMANIQRNPNLVKHHIFHLMHDSVNKANL